MTAGAVSVHGELQKMTMVELEPKVLGAIERFSRFNNDVINNPKLEVVIGDGRNFLLTTRDAFDVITSDPIHPSLRGAANLYTTEYFRLIAEHLKPGGIVSQWLPLYNMGVEDMRSVIKTFSENFAHTMLWCTYGDAQIIGSNLPIIIDERNMRERISRNPLVLRGLNELQMFSVEDLLSNFVMGNKGTRKISEGATINTDNNVHLEFSAPVHHSNLHDKWMKFQYILQNRESILPYLKKPTVEQSRDSQAAKWNRLESVARLYDRALVLRLRGAIGSPAFMELENTLDTKYPTYYPWKVMKKYYSWN